MEDSGGGTSSAGLGTLNQAPYGRLRSTEVLKWKGMVMLLNIKFSQGKRN